MPLSSSQTAHLHSKITGLISGKNRVLLPYQVDYLMDTSRYLLWEKSRRVGVTWASALKSVLKRVTLGKKMDHLFSSKDEPTGKEFLLYCRQWVEKFNDWLGVEVADLKQWTSEIGLFPNGSRILVLSSNPNAMRSNGGDVTLDEWAFHEQAGELYDAAQPCLTWFPEAQLELISTHNGVESEFYRLCREAEQGVGRGKHFKRYAITLQQAVEQGLARKIWKQRIPEFKDKGELDTAFLADVRAGCRTEEAWQQEYCCAPAMSGCLVSPDEFDRCAYKADGKTLLIGETAPTELDQKKYYNALFLGIDCGRSKDLTVTTAIEQGMDPEAPSHLSTLYRVACMNTMFDQKFPVQEAVIRPIASHRSINGGFIDMGSVGRGLADAVQDETGSMVEGYAFTAPRKAAMAERVKQFFQQRRIAVPADPKLKADICCVRKTQGPSGAWKYEGQCSDSHGDRFWSLALALEAAEAANPITLNTSSAMTVKDKIKRSLPAPEAA
jgi:phage FluMu gp28-like protein